MNAIRKIILAAALALCASPAAAQTSPNWTYGYVPTTAQWNAQWASKQDYLGSAPCLVTGCTMISGTLTTAASSATAAGFNLPPGAAPTSPNNGDLWTTTLGAFVQINGSTINLTGASGASFAGTSPIKVTFPAGVVTYAFDFTVANTFLAQQNAQGATTTQPGWFVQVAGDAVPRIHLGLTTADVGTLSFGGGSATRDAFIQRVGPASLRQGGPDAAAPVAQTFGVQNVLAGTSNVAGAAWTMNGSRGTGTGIGGSIVFQTAPAGSTGSTQNALVNALTIFGDGGVNVGSPTGGDKGPGTINLAGSLYVNNVATGGTVSSGTSNQLAYYASSGTTISGLSTNASSVLISSGGGTLSWSTTLPSGIAATSMALTTPAIGVATGTSLALGGATIGSNALAITGTFAFSAGGSFGGALTGITTLASGAHTITSSSASALAVGPNGATNPAFSVNAAAGSLASGVGVSGDVTAGTPGIFAIDSGPNTNLTINSKGGGSLTLNNTATGSIVLARATTISAALTYGGVTLSNSVTGTASMVLSASPTLTGTTTVATLAATTINGAALSGTFSGTPTFSGAITFGAGITAASLAVPSSNIAGSLCATSGGVFLYFASNNCFASGAATSISILTTTVTSGTSGQFLTTTTSGCSGTTPCLTQVANVTTSLSDVTAPTPYSPTDASGASLTFTSPSGLYTKVGKQVTLQFRVTYPSTASGATASFSIPVTSNASLPSAGSGTAVGTCNSGTVAIMFPLMLNSANAAVLLQASGLVTNANLSTTTLNCEVHYISS